MAASLSNSPAVEACAASFSTSLALSAASASAASTSSGNKGAALPPFPPAEEEALGKAHFLPLGGSAEPLESIAIRFALVAPGLEATACHPSRGGPLAFPPRGAKAATKGSTVAPAPAATARRRS